MSSGQSSSQQQQPPRKPPLADWPTIKILEPPQGPASRQTDEWCITYCSQSVSGRIHNKEPYCRSLCVRKVFPHEVRNLIAFKAHKKLDSSGKANYPLPAEGQPASLPWVFGGKQPEDPEDPRANARPKEPPKTWDEGLYLWTGKGRMAAHQKLESMSLDFERQQRVLTMRAKRREVWQEYQDSLRQNVNVQDDNVRLWVPNVPPKPLPDTSSDSLLIPLPPQFPPVLDRINKLLSPTFHVLSILRDSLKSGEQRQFARRVWEKAWTNEPFFLASKTVTRAYERWKERDETGDEEDDKNSP